jgi:hypothetical protein
MHYSEPYNEESTNGAVLKRGAFWLQALIAWGL